MPIKRAIKTAKPVSSKPATKPVTAPVKPVAVLGAAAAAQAVSGRSNVAGKPATTTKPVAGAPTVAKPSGRIQRTISTIAAQATNFGGISDRDNAYIAFYASLAKADKAGLVTVQSIYDSGARPAYIGSNKPHDAGVIVRLTKAGVIKPTSGHSGFTFADTAKTLAAYATAKPLATRA